MFWNKDKDKKATNESIVEQEEETDYCYECTEEFKLKELTRYGEDDELYCKKCLEEKKKEDEEKETMTKEKSKYNYKVIIEFQADANGDSKENLEIQGVTEGIASGLLNKIYNNLINEKKVIMLDKYTGWDEDNEETAEYFEEVLRIEDISRVSIDLMGYDEE